MVYAGETSNNNNSNNTSSNIMAMQQQQQQQQNASLNNQPFCYSNCFVVNIDGPINFNATHSLQDDGADLPLNDINTIRFFYNLGIEVGLFSLLLFLSTLDYFL